MKYLCLMLLVVGAVYAAPVEEVKDTTAQHSLPAPEGSVASKKVTTTKMPHVVEILESGSEHNMDGSYSFHFRGADGSFREETAVVKDAGTEHEHLEVTGAYSFFDTDGKEVIVHYKAGDGGFVPVGNNIPEEISLAAKENSELPSMDEYDDAMNRSQSKNKKMMN